MSTTAPYVYQQAPLTTDATAIKIRVANYMSSYMPAGFNIPAGSWLDLLIEAFAIEAATQNDVAQTKLTGDFRYFGKLVNLPPIDAVSATATVTFTVTSSVAAQTISAASTVIGIIDSTGTMQGFTLTADITIPPSTTSVTGTVLAQAAGATQNGLSGSATLIQTPSFVTAASLSTAIDGVDAESDADYLNRLTETLGLLTPIPVLGSNFAVLARATPGVYRACGVNLLKPGPPYDGTAEATGQDKNVTVAVTDVTGMSVGSTIRAACQTALQATREDNFVIWVVDAQYDTIDVTVCNVYSWPGWDTTELQATITAALGALLSPATFSTDASGIAARWANDPVLHASALYEAVMSCSQGVRNVDPIQFGIHGGTIGTADVTLGAGSAIPALPQAGAITVTVTPTTG